jgi:ribosomal protein S18 acetylase RimI-like enzyme
VTFQSSARDAVFIAETSGNLVGVVSLHILELFHEAGRLGRITAFVVDADSRGNGIGTALVAAADKFFRSSGCVRAEVTSGNHRPPHMTSTRRKDTF